MSWAKLPVIPTKNVAAINKGLIENFCIIVLVLIRVKKYKIVD
jgi:hypothetical protein